MILLTALLAPAARAELPWECPAIASPEDADVYRATDGGSDAVVGALEVDARAWIEDDCAWSQVALEDGSVESTCVTSIGATVVAVEGEYSYLVDNYFYYSGSSWSITIELPPGVATWTSLTVGWAQDGSSSGSRSYSTRQRRYATWTGTVEDAPDDGAIESDYEESCSSAGCSMSRTVTTPACSWSWYRSDGGSDETVETGGHLAAVPFYRYACGELDLMGSFDGEKIGRVFLDTWARDPADADGDGWPAGPNDCDDADPARYACQNVDTVGDGIDQDCDGVDGVAPSEDTGPVDTADTADSDSPEDTGPSGGPEPERPVASTASDCTHGCGSGAALLVALAPLAHRRRRC